MYPPTSANNPEYKNAVIIKKKIVSESDNIIDEDIENSED